MSIIKPNYTNNPSENTKLFLENVIGHYIKIIIHDNKPHIENITNELLMCFDNALYRGHIAIPINIIKMMNDLCEAYIISDTEIYFSGGDFAVITKDITIHPQYDRFPRKHDVYPECMLKIFSQSKIPRIHNDKLLPTSDFIDLIYSCDEFKNDKYLFRFKKPIAVFRGSMTGIDRTINNPRMQTKILSLRYPSYLDADLSSTYNYYIHNPDMGQIPICTTIINDIIGTIYDPLDDPLDDAISKKEHPYLTFTEQCKYKYILHIDGFVAAWRMAKEMFSKSVILKVDSEWVEHFYNDLVPWKHYIPIKSDLSDLIQRIVWCRQNDSICEEISNNAYEFAISNFTKEKMLEYVYKSITDDAYDPSDHVKTWNIPLFDISLNSIPDPENIISFNEINYEYKYMKYHDKVIDNNIMKIKIKSKISFYGMWTPIQINNLFVSFAMCGSLYDKIYLDHFDNIKQITFTTKLHKCNFLNGNKTNELVDTIMTLQELVSNINSTYNEIKVIFSNEINDALQNFYDIYDLHRVNFFDIFSEFELLSVNDRHWLFENLYIDSTNINNGEIVEYFVRLDNNVKLIDFYTNIIKTNICTYIYLDDIKVHFSSDSIKNVKNTYNIENDANAYIYVALFHYKYILN